MTRLYYTAPPNDCFNELKARAIDLWNTMGDEQSYRDEKIGRIKDIKNVSDNFMYIFAMFDHSNQRKVGETLSKLTKDALNERLIDGGSDYAVLE